MHLIGEESGKETPDAAWINASAERFVRGIAAIGDRR